VGFQGPIGQKIEIALGQSQFFYFGPFRAGEIVRAAVIQAIDTSGSVTTPLDLGMAIFTGRDKPVSGTVVFSKGKQLLSGTIIGLIPTVELAASPDDAPAIRIPINHRFEKGDHWIGFWIQNNTANARAGGLYIDTDIGVSVPPVRDRRDRLVE